MSLYQQSDITLLQDNWEKIMEKVEEQKYIMLEPTKEEMQQIHKIILDFVKENKRKIYGGFALDLLIKEKVPVDVIYKPGYVSDIDFYSPRPIVDLMKLCNILTEKGFKSVIGREAQHQETYNITVNYLTYCDISYVPKNIYDRMPYKETDGYMLIHPHFMWIDYLRMFSDPLISYWRMNNDIKSFRRFYLLQKHFDFPYNKYPIEIEGSSPSLDKVLKEIYDFVVGRQTVILIGFYAYNYFLKESGLDNKKLKLLQIPYFEIISTNYRVDCLQILANIGQIMTIDNTKVTSTEFYPFFQYTDNSVEIYYNGDLVARVYNHNKKCIPYQDVPAIDFTNLNKINAKSNETVRMATFPTVLMYSIVSIMKSRVQQNDDEKSLYYAMTSHLIEMRKFFFTRNKKTMLDDTIFKEFEAKCIGTTMQPDRQRKLMIESRKKKNKRWVFSYDPSEGIKEPESTYLFSNTSGNKIINQKNLKLSLLAKEDDPEGDFDEEGLDEKIE